jgi:hypothetical protein
MIAAATRDTIAPYLEPVVTDEEYAQMWREALGGEFKALRQERTELNQKEMSEKLGWNSVQVAKLERGIRMAVDYHLIYARYLEADFADLVESAQYEVDRLIKRREIYGDSDE